MSITPWSVKGVAPEAREAAKLAARRAELTLGEWLNQTIRAAATAQLKHPSDTPPSNDATAAVNSAETEAGDSRPTADGPGLPENASGSHQPPAPTIQAMFERIQNLSKRLETSEQRTRGIVGPLQSRIDALSKELDEVKDRSGVSTAPVERAVTRLSERIQRIEDGHNKDPAKKGPFGLRRSS